MTIQPRPENATTALAEIRARDGTDADMPAIHAIYSWHVLNGFGSFEEVPPTEEEMRRRRADILARGLPYLVAEDREGTILGYCYAGPFRPRTAYRHTVEDSIYVHPEAGRRGVGQRLMTELIERCTALGFRQMVAVIGDSGNAGSISLHSRMGFRTSGVLPSVGFKRGRWVDSVLMQRALGDGDSTLPREG